jgi:hypothetical protein
MLIEVLLPVCGENTIAGIITGAKIIFFHVTIAATWYNMPRYE